MEEQSGIAPADEFLQHILCLAGRTLDIYFLQNSDYVLEQKLSIPDTTTCGLRVFSCIGVEETEDAQLSAYEGSSAGLQVWRTGNVLRGEIGVTGNTICANVHGEKLVPIDIATANQGKIRTWRRTSAGRSAISRAARDEVSRAWVGGGRGGRGGRARGDELGGLDGVGFEVIGRAPVVLDLRDVGLAEWT